MALELATPTTTNAAPAAPPGQASSWVATRAAWLPRLMAIAAQSAVPAPASAAAHSSHERVTAAPRNPPMRAAGPVAGAGPGAADATWMAPVAASANQ